MNSAGTGFLSGHADGSIVRWYVAEDQAARAQGKIVVHSIPPYAMAWTSQHIAVAGPDKKVVFYTMDGMMAQQFDYFRYWVRVLHILCTMFLPSHILGTTLRRSSP